MNSVGNVAAGPFAFFADVHENQRLTGIQLFLDGLDTFFLDVFLRFANESEKPFCVIHRHKNSSEALVYRRSRLGPTASGIVTFHSVSYRASSGRLWYRPGWV